MKRFQKISGPRIAAAGLLGLMGFVFTTSLRAQWVIPQGGDQITFDQTITGVNNGPYNGTQPAVNPGPGMLDAGAWEFTVFPVFRGVDVFGAPLGVGRQSGIYGMIGGQPGSLGSGRELGFVPPNGSASTFASFNLLTVNGTGSAVDTVNLSLDFNYFNSTNRGVTLNVSFTIGGVTTALGNLTFTPTNGVGTIMGTRISSGLVNLGTTVANGGQIQFTFTLATNGSGAGNVHDEVGLDNITLIESFSGVPEPATYAAGALALGVLGVALRRRRSAGAVRRLRRFAA